MAEFEINCPKCRSTKMRFPREEIKGSDVIICAACGFNLGTMKSIRDKMVKAVNRLKKAVDDRKLQ
jgi:ribosomal protein L34E